MNDNLVAAKAAMVAFFGGLFAFLGWRMVLLLVWVFLMCVDYLSGTLAARQNGTWKSQKAKDGVGHKIGMIFVVLVVGVADFVMLVICDSLPNDVLPFNWPMPIFTTPMVSMTLRASTGTHDKTSMCKIISMIVNSSTDASMPALRIAPSIPTALFQARYLAALRLPNTMSADTVIISRRTKMLPINAAK